MALLAQKQWGVTTN